MNPHGSQLTVDRWSFWSPESESPSDWLRVHRGELEHPEPHALQAASIPPMHRRRMSRLSKMAVQVALSVSEPVEPGYIVFTSRHGEIVRTRKLLSDIASGEELSPTEFSQSVHNTGVGLYSIIRGSQAPAMALASGAASFAYGWLEAEGYLAEHPDAAVLLVDSDDVVPAEYRPFLTQESEAYALALLVSVGGDHGVSLTVGEGADDSRLPIGPQVLSWLLSPAGPLQLDAEGRRFTWERGRGT